MPKTPSESIIVIGGYLNSSNQPGRLFKGTISKFRYYNSVLTDEEINKWIHQGIEYFRENPEEYSYFMGSGNSMVHMYKFDEDKEYYVVVSKDYELGEIEFEKEDCV